MGSQAFSPVQHRVQSRTLKHQQAASLSLRRVTWPSSGIGSADRGRQAPGAGGHRRCQSGDPEAKMQR